MDALAGAGRSGSASAGRCPLEGVTVDCLVGQPEVLSFSTPVDSPSSHPVPSFIGGAASEGRTVGSTREVHVRPKITSTSRVGVEGSLEMEPRFPVLVFWKVEDGPRVLGWLWLRPWAVNPTVGVPRRIPCAKT